MLCLAEHSLSRLYIYDMWILQLLNEPYPLNSIRRMTWFAASVSIFVFLFLSFFQPFGLGADSFVGLLKVTVVYGLITFFTMVLATVFLRWLFPGFFSESRWVFGRELFIVMVNFFLIGVFNTLYSNYMFQIGLGFSGFLMFQLYTMGVGFFPILFYMMLKYTHLLRSNIKEADELSGSIQKTHPAPEHSDQSKIRIHSELKKDDLEINTTDLVYAETADNYVAIHHLEKGRLSKNMVRSTLGKVETDLAGHTRIVRCHRAYIVNLDFVESFKGNAQGLQLRLKHLDQEVPVSRNMVEKIRNLLRS